MKPQVCNFFVTLRCNDTCEFCRTWRDETLDVFRNTEVPFTKENLAPIFGDLRRIGVSYIEITGGEPLLRDDLDVFLSLAKRYRFFTSLTTNGLLLEEKIGQLAGKLNRLMISLDFPDEENHDRSRGVECFAEVLTGIKAAKAHGIQPQIIYTLTKDSINNLPELSDFAEEHQVLVWLNPVYDYYGFENYEADTYRYLKYFMGKKHFAGNLAALSFLQAGGNKIAAPRCRAAQATVNITPDLKLALPCLQSPQKYLEINGKLFDVWQSAQRRAEEKNHGRYQECAGCKAWPYMLPSFWFWIDRYFWLSLYSGLDLRRKV